MRGSASPRESSRPPWLPHSSMLSSASLMTSMPTSPLSSAPKVLWPAGIQSAADPRPAGPRRTLPSAQDAPNAVEVDLEVDKPAQVVLSSQRVLFSPSDWPTTSARPEGAKGDF